MTLMLRASVTMLAFSAAFGKNMGKHGGFLSRSSRSVAASKVKKDVQAALDETTEMLGRGHGIDSMQLESIKAFLEPTFDALPKNRRGRVSSSVMRRAVSQYLGQKHAWIVKGFEETRSNVSNVDAPVLQDMLPGFVTSILEDKLEKEGFALIDVVTIAAVVEQLITNEEAKVVDQSFTSKNLSVVQTLSLQQLQEVVYTYLMTELITGVTDDLSQQQLAISDINSIYPHWATTQSYIDDLIFNADYAKQYNQNPFKPNSYFYEDAVKVAARISQNFGPWSNHECLDMRELLMAKDPFARGRVLLNDFYKRSEDGGWQFHESTEYLRQLGALDETSPALGPQVVIPNYVLGMSNCITSTKLYAVCCLNECDSIFRDIAQHVKMHNPTVGSITKIVGEISTSTAEARNVTGTLLARLEQIAGLHRGRVPIHGRLFNQWLHFMFPRECPYPHVAGTINPMSHVEFERAGIEKELTEEELANVRREYGNKQLSPQVGETAWDLTEELLPSTTASDSFSWEVAAFGRTVATLGVLMGMLGIIISMLIKVTETISGASEKVKLCTV